jgi:hypothetical protein
VSLGGLEQYIKGELCLLLAGLDLGPVEKDYDSRIGRSVSKFAQEANTRNQKGQGSISLGEGFYGWVRGT